MDAQTEQIWHAFNIKLKHFIRKRVSGDEAAKDILQEVFLKIHTHIGTLRSNDKLQGWVYQITRNVIIDYYRKRRPLVQLDEAAAVWWKAEDGDIGAKEELSDCIKEIVMGLPEKYREALILTEYRGLKQKDLEGKLCLSGSGAKSRVQRARVKVKEVLLLDCHHELARSGVVIDYQPCCCCCCTKK
ncbi:MAG: RNA polymerase sigma factor SigZ [Candidatus Aminicenantes bacterium]|nr:RNA polymerase sigma factor SigZ [Candidatus Aminicenantes bacterium]